MSTNNLKTKDLIQIDCIDKILKMYPELKKDRTSIVTEIMGIKNKDYSNEFVLIKFKHGGEYFYKDWNGSIWDKHAKIVGAYEYRGNSFKYYFFKKLTKSKALSKSIDKYKLV